MFGKKMTVVSVDDSHNVIVESPWIDHLHLNQLTQWLPVLGEVEDVSCFGFLNLNEDLCAFYNSIVSVGRSIGAPNQVVSQVLPFKRRALNHYFENPALLAHYCLSDGLFSRDVEDDATVLAANEIVFDPKRWANEFEIDQLREIGRSVGLHGRAVVFRAGNPIKLLAGIYSMMAENQDPVNFCCGATLTDRLPYQLQVCQEMDTRAKAFLNANSIRYFQAREMAQIA